MSRPSLSASRSELDSGREALQSKGEWRVAKPAGAYVSLKGPPSPAVAWLGAPVSSSSTTMPAPAPFPSAHPAHPFPALYLYPLNDSFVPKHIALTGGQRVKIGRQTNAKTVPAERNGYFDSKVLSRQHAEVWEENGKVCIRYRRSDHIARAASSSASH